MINNDPAVVGEACASMQGVLTLQAVQGVPIHTNLADAAFVLLQLPPHPTLRSVRGVKLIVGTCSCHCQSGIAGSRGSAFAESGILPVIDPTPDCSSTTPRPCMSSLSHPAAADTLE